MKDLIGKRELADALGWSRPTLDKRLKTDADFPVVTRGDQKGGWLFSLKSVKGYLSGGEKPRSAKPTTVPASPGPAIDQAQLRDAVRPPSAAPTVVLPKRPTAQHHGEATARQRKDAADAALRENKLRVENLDLVEKAKIRETLADVFAALGNDLDALPEEISKLLDLPDEAPRIRDLIDKARTRMVANAAPLLNDV